MSAMATWLSENQRASHLPTRPHPTCRFVQFAVISLPHRFITYHIAATAHATIYTAPRHPHTPAIQHTPTTLSRTTIKLDLQHHVALQSRN